MDSAQLKERIALLRSVELFAEAPPQALEPIAERLRSLRVSEGYQFITKGEHGDCLYIIAEGRVKVHDAGHTFVEMGKGKVVGEYALLDAEQRSASVTTLTESVLMRLDQSEFYDLTRSYPEILAGVTHLLVQRLRFQNNTIIANLQKREQELSQLVAEQTQDLRRANAGLTNALEEIKTQNEALANAFKEIEEQNTHITDSIRYARRIQEAILPHEEDMRRVFPEMFVFYRPKDIVSGDFYWFTQTERYVYLAAVDCTGHGVPGAFMSVLGYSLLNQIVHNRAGVSPDKVLNALNDFVIQSLRQAANANATNDGMDISICAFDLENRKLYFAGANNGVTLFRKDEEFTLRPDKFPIGGDQFDNRVFSLQTFDLQVGDAVYLYSDGYHDQFGGEDGRKFSTRRFRETLAALQNLPFSEQKTELARVMDEWMANREQIDDMMVLGVKL